MKKYFLFLLILISIQLLQAQWEPDVRLTNDTGACYICLNNARGIAISGSDVHLVWCDERNGNREIYYKRSTNGGTNWGQDIRFTNDSAVSWRPSVAVSGSVVHTVWCDFRNGNFEIYYKRSTDGGVSWSQDTRLTNDSAISWAPSMAVNGSTIHIVWEETRDGNEEIYYKRSTDAGLSWGQDTRLTNNPLNSLYPSVAVSGSSVHVSWYDFRTGSRAIFYKRSTDGGMSWGNDVQLTGNYADSYNPAVAVSGQVVHIAWHDRRDGNEDIFYRRSGDGGVNWEPEIRLTNNSSVSWYPSISVSGSAVHLAWYDNYEGNYEIYYDRSTDGGASWEPALRLTNNNGGSYRPSICVSDSTVHVIWNDDRDGDWEIYYKRNPTGNPIGIKNNYSEIPDKIYLYQNYPNPFNSVSSIKYQVSRGAEIRIIVFDISGREITTLMNEKKSPGKYEVRFNGEGLSSGIYFYSLFADGERVGTKRMVLIK